MVYQSALLARGPAIVEDDVARALMLEKQQLRDAINVSGW